MIIKATQQLRTRLWSFRPASRLGRWGLESLRALDALVTVFARGQLSLWAMSLVYTTLLSLTPFLALGFSLLKALGVHNSLEPVLIEALKGLGNAQAKQVSDTVVTFVSKVEVGVLGSLGVALLLYSAVSLIQKVEGAFNEVWQVENPRGISHRLTEYLAVLTVGPVLVFSALGLTAGALNGEWAGWIARFEPFGFFLYMFSTILPYLLIVGVFTFLYAFVPQARVRARAAFIGGVVAGLLWQTLSYAFAAFVAGATDYNAIYSGFAIIIFVLIWLYVGWLILLAGCQIAYYVQHPARMNPLLSKAMPAGRAREQAALTLMVQIGLRFLHGQPPQPRELLAKELGLSETGLQALAAPLIEGGYLAESGPSLLMARDPASYELATLWQHLRGARPSVVSAPQVASWLDQAEQAAAAQGRQSFRDWLAGMGTTAGMG
ncbi:MAG: YihY/virulence factor BrkB family protein [Pseudomonadota bacterium]